MSIFSGMGFTLERVCGELANKGSLKKKNVQKIVLSDYKTHYLQRHFRLLAESRLGEVNHLFPQCSGALAEPSGGRSQSVSSVPR